MTNSSSPHCLNSTAEVTMVAVFLVTRFLLVLLASVLVLHLGLRRRRQGSRSSHSDVFTYHSAAMELVYAWGAAFGLCGRYGGASPLTTAGYYLCSVVLPGQTCLHTLTCVDRYLAVVHPVAYLRLRQAGGVRLLGLGCVWLLCVAWTGLTALYSPRVPYVPYFCTFSLFSAVVSFCSVSVLRSLRRPGPGGGTKRRAFGAVAAITAVLWLHFLGFLVCVAVENAGEEVSCLLLVSGQWFALPSSLVLPLLFLHSRGKLL